MDIIQSYADGRSRVRFRTAPAKETTRFMGEMIELWNRGVREKWIPPLVLAAALNLDKSPRGEKTAAVLAAIDRQVSTFRVADLQAECPGVGVDLNRQSAGSYLLREGHSGKWPMPHACTKHEPVEQPTVARFAERVGWGG